MLKYQEIKNIYNSYEVNHYYNEDILFYKLLYFMNQLFLYKKNHPNFLTAKEETVAEGDGGAQDADHPCSISDIDQYYQEIIDKFNYDCIYDFCFFHNCEELNDLNVNKINLYLPNCYCIPLYCRDAKTQKNSKFEKLLKEKLDCGYENFDYAFNNKYDSYYSEIQEPFSQLHNYFDRKNLMFRCDIIFNKRTREENKFISNFVFHRFLDNKKIIVFFFVYNNLNLSKIVEIMNEKAYSIINNIVLGYLIFVFIVFVLLLTYIYFTCNIITKKMLLSRNIRKLIITQVNSTTENKNNNKKIFNKKENNEDNNNECDNNSLINEKNDENIDNNNENEILIVNQEKKENNNNDLDELDELIKLINDNLNTFKIEFNLNEASNDNINDIKKKYNEIIQVNKYKNKLLLNEDEEIIFENNINDSSMSSSNNSTHNKKKNNNKKEDLSVNIFCELLSLSNHKFDFSNIKTNFYYKENNDNSLYNLKEIISGLNEANNNNSNENFEITNIEKLKNALEHYYNKIHKYWKGYYDLQKAKDEI